MEKVLNNEEKLKVSQYNLIIDRLKELNKLICDVELNRNIIYQIYDDEEKNYFYYTYNDLFDDLENQFSNKINNILYSKNNRYELVVELKDDLDKSKRKEIINKLKDVINDTDSEIIKFENIGKKVLPYEYKGYKKAYYYVLTYEFMSNDIEEINSKITKIERFIRITDEILKFINVKVDFED